MDDAPEMVQHEGGQDTISQPVVVHVRSMATGKSLSFDKCFEKPSNVENPQYFGEAPTVIKNIKAGITKTPIRLCFDSARVLELFANSYDTAPFKDIELVLSYFDTPTKERLSALSKFHHLSRLQVFWNVFPESCSLKREEIEHQFVSSVGAECAVTVKFQKWGITFVAKNSVTARDLPSEFSHAESSTNNDLRFYHYHWPELDPPHFLHCLGYRGPIMGVEWARHEALRGVYMNLMAAWSEIPSSRDLMQQALGRSMS